MATLNPGFGLGGGGFIAIDKYAAFFIFIHFFNHNLNIPTDLLQSILSIKMLFSELYGNLLPPFVQKFKDAKNEKGRKIVVNNAADAVKKGKDLHEYSDNLPKDLKSICNLFYSFHILIHMYGFRS